MYKIYSVLLLVYLLNPRSLYKVQMTKKKKLILADPFLSKTVPFFFSDLFKYRLINSRLINSTFLHNKEGCLLDFSDENNAYMIYFVSFLGTLAVLPGNIVSALLMDKIGRLRMLGE